MLKFIGFCALLIALALPTWGAEAPVIAVPQVDTAPLLDGRISPGEWANAAVTCGFREYGSGYPAKGKTVVSLCYDTSNLYILYRCHGEDLNKLIGASGPKDSPVWNDSEVEAFIVPSDWTGGKYAHFMANHAGTMADEMDSGSSDASWNPDWKCSTGKESDMWFMEMAIPWSSLNITPKTGMVFKANFARNSASTSEISSWSHVAGSFHQPQFFGKLALAGKGLVISIVDLPGKESGEYILSPVVIGSLPGTVSFEYKVEPLPGSRISSGNKVKLTSGMQIPITVGYGTREITFKATGAGSQVLWQQHVKMEIPDIPGRIASLEKNLATRLKKSTLTKSEAELIASKLGVVKTKALLKQDNEGLASLVRELTAIDCQMSDLNSLIAAKRFVGKDSKMTYFVTNPVSTLKIQPNAPDPGPLAKQLRIAMAKAEYEPVQIAVCPVKDDLKGVIVSSSRLTGPNGVSIPAERIVVTPIASVICKGSTSGARLTDEIPDILLPNRRMNVAAGRRQPYFVTVQTTSDDVPGIYRGTVRVAADNAPSTNLPLIVRVYNVTLPVKSHMRTAFVLWGSFSRFLESTGPNANIDTYIRYSKMMLSYRISPITMWSPGKDAYGNWDFSKYDKLCSALVPKGLTTLNIGGNGEVAGAKNAEFVSAAKQYLKSRGWWDLVYIYGYDEAPGNLQDQLVTNYKALVDAVPDVKVMQTGWSPTERLKGLVKIWCPLTANADLAACYKAQKEGDEVWWYVCVAPTAPYANLFVDYPGIDHRMLGWMTYKYKITGLLYWGVDVWPKNNDTLDSYDRTNYANWNPNSFATVMGDGYLLYPGHNDTPVASMRLALLRDGIEDYDLFKTTEAFASKHGKAGQRIRDLLSIHHSIINTLTDFNQNGKDLLAYRERVLKAAELLNVK